MSHRTTQILVSKAKSGDRAAFNGLVARYEERLRTSIRARIGPHLRGKLEPEDLFQETMLRAFQSISHFTWRDETSFLRWLQAIAENRIRDAVKGPRGDDQLQLPNELLGNGVSPSKHARRNERFDRLEQALKRLRPDHRQVITLARIEGHKTKEIARRMNRSESAVKNLLLRGLRELKSHFGDTESLHLPERNLGINGAHDDEHRSS